jgi:hypothetical protein
LVESSAKRQVAAGVDFLNLRLTGFSGGGAGLSGLHGGAPVNTFEDVGFTAGNPDSRIEFGWGIDSFSKP